MSLVTVHDRLAFAILLYVMILFIWGLWRIIRKLNVDGNFRGALVIAESLILGQGVLGIILVIIGLTPERGGMHFLYGVVGALGIPLVFTFNKVRNDPSVMLVSTAVLFFIAVIFVRSMSTG